MKTNKVRQRIARQPERHARPIHAENERPAGAQVNLSEYNLEPQPLQQRAREILVAHACAAGNQHQISPSNPIQIKPRPGRFKIFRQMFLLQFNLKRSQEPADQTGIAVANLSRLRGLFRRHQFIARGEMGDPQARIHQRPGAARRRQQREFAGVQLRPGLDQHLSSLHVFTATAQIQTVFVFLDMNCVSFTLHMFLHHHPHAVARQCRARSHAHCFAALQRARFPIRRVDRVHDSKTFGRIIGQNGIAVARGTVA